MIVAVFGPYVLKGFGIRTEQLVIYPLCLMALVLGCRNGALPRMLRRASLVWLLLLMAGVAVSFWFSRPITKILAGADDYLLPVAAMIVLSGCFPDARRSRNGSDVGWKVCAAIEWCLAANTGIEILEFLFPRFPSYLGLFWTGTIAAGERAVGNYALDAQRLIGIFNQPMEQGVAYAVGLFCWLHRASLKPPSLRDYLLLAALLVGGFGGTSKVFLFGALPVFVLCYGPSVGHSRRRASRIMITAFAIVAGSVAISYYSDAIAAIWPGSARITEMFQSENLIRGITAGRLSAKDDSVLQPLVSKVYETSPIFGIGFGGLDTVDSAYLSVYMSAGILGLLLYLVTLGVLLKSGMRRKSGRRPPGLWIATVMFVAGVGIGAPVLTLNRASTLIWCWLWVLANHASFVGSVTSVRSHFLLRRQPRVTHSVL
ncbi:MAG TPA: hypothetical protein VG273_05300 [Bryobacteraceae bacterium]|nr:hypothetical protein [Bryobacteraceae bacterium]